MITAEFRLDHTLLRRALEEAPAVELEWVRSVRDGDRRKAVLWGEHVDDPEVLEKGFAADPTCELERATGTDRRRLYEVWLDDDASGMDIYSAVVETGTVVERATVDRDGWHCRYVFPDESALDRFFEECREHGIGFDVERVRRSDGVDGEDPALTTAQREAVEAAHAVGYFDVPRAGSLEDVADRLDISTTAAGHRLRRGLGRLVERELRPGRDVP